MKKIIKSIPTILVICGFFLMLGSVGAAENNGITMWQMMWQSAIGLGMIFVGMGGMR